MKRPTSQQLAELMASDAEHLAEGWSHSLCLPVGLESPYAGTQMTCESLSSLFLQQQYHYKLMLKKTEIKTCNLHLEYIILIPHTKYWNKKHSDRYNDPLK